MTDKAVTRWLAAIAAAALIVFFVVWATRNAEQRSELWLDVGKGMVQLAVVGVLGTVIKLLADAYQARRRRAEARDEFRRDKYRRLVAATSVLRRVPIFIRANQSLETWSEQMQNVLDADAELRQIKHEIFSSAGIPDPPFPNGGPIVKRLERMFAYTTWVADEFAEHKKDLVEEKDVWEKIRAVPSVEDMLKATDDASPEERSWAGYLADETVVLQLMMKASLGTSPRDRLARRPGRVS